MTDSQVFTVVWTRSSAKLAEALVARWDDVRENDEPVFSVLGKRDGRWLVGRRFAADDPRHDLTDQVSSCPRHGLQPVRRMEHNEVHGYVLLGCGCVLVEDRGDPIDG